MKVKTSLKAGECYPANSVFGSDNGDVLVVDPVCTGDTVQVTFTDGTTGDYIVP
jgi:hypothetical protein